jgi:hypothetical protein
VCVLFIGTRFSNLYTSVDTPTRGRVVCEVRVGKPVRGGVCVYYCSTYYKAVREGWGGESGGHVLRETTSRGLCELVCPSCTKIDLDIRGENKEEECVFITAVPITEAGCVLLHTKLFARGFPLCVFITAVPNTKLFARGGGGPMQSNNVVPSSQRMRSNQLILSNIFDGAIYI